MNLEALRPLLSRKFLLTVLVTVLAVVAVNVPGEVKLEFLKWVLGIYVVGNVAQKMTTPAPMEVTETAKE